MARPLVNRIGFFGEAAAIGVALLDKRTPWPARLISALSVFYLLNPIDFAPDFIPLLGWVDDALITPLAFMLATRFIPGAVMDDARKRFSKKAK